MTATVDTNSYVTESEADTYFADKFGYAEWTAATSANKNAALVSAAQYLDVFCRWYGYKYDSEQLLEFPRAISTIEAYPTPTAIENAQCEIAYAIITTGSVSTVPTERPSEIKAGPVSMKFSGMSIQNPLVNELVLKLVAPYGSVSLNSMDVVLT